MTHRSLSPLSDTEKETVKEVLDCWLLQQLDKYQIKMRKSKSKTTSVLHSQSSQAYNSYLYNKGRDERRILTVLKDFKNYEVRTLIFFNLDG
jgi:hypothetical protein